MAINVKRMGHAVLRVEDLDRSIEFYAKLGLHEVARGEFDGEHWVFLSAGDSHHDLALVEGGTGLHHLAFNIGESTAALLDAERSLGADDVTIHATLDFRVSQALIVSDPDGHVVELYVDTPGEPWRADPSLVAYAAALDLHG